jgi:hypothetical protein
MVWFNKKNLFYRKHIFFLEGWFNKKIVLRTFFLRGLIQQKTCFTNNIFPHGLIQQKTCFTDNIFFPMGWFNKKIVLRTFFLRGLIQQKTCFTNNIFPHGLIQQKTCFTDNIFFPMGWFNKKNCYSITIRVYAVNAFLSKFDLELSVIAKVFAFKNWQTNMSLC